MDNTLNQWISRLKKCDFSFENKIKFTGNGKPRKRFPHQAAKGYVLQLVSLSSALTKLPGFNIALYKEGLAALSDLNDMMTGTKGVVAFVSVLHLLRNLIETLNFQNILIEKLESDIKKLVEEKIKSTEAYLSSTDFDLSSSSEEALALSLSQQNRVPHRWHVPSMHSMPPSARWQVCHPSTAIDGDDVCFSQSNASSCRSFISAPSLSTMETDDLDQDNKPVIELDAQDDGDDDGDDDDDDDVDLTLNQLTVRVILSTDQ